MQSVIVAMKMLSVILVIFLLSGFTDAEDYEKYGKRGEIAKEASVQGSVRTNDVICNEGETLRECCSPDCEEATCHRPNIHSSSGVSQNRKSDMCLAQCLCKQPLVRGPDRKCVPVSQCPSKNGQYN